jgi:hypothetical protein
METETAASLWSSPLVLALIAFAIGACLYGLIAMARAWRVSASHAPFAALGRQELAHGLCRGALHAAGGHGTCEAAFLFRAHHGGLPACRHRRHLDRRIRGLSLVPSIIRVRHARLMPGIHGFFL